MECGIRDERRASLLKPIIFCPGADLYLSLFIHYLPKTTNSLSFPLWSHHIFFLHSNPLLNVDNCSQCAHLLQPPVHHLNWLTQATILPLFRCQSGYSSEYVSLPILQLSQSVLPCPCYFSHCLHLSHSWLPHLSCLLPLKILWIPLLGEEILPSNSRTQTGLRN